MTALRTLGLPRIVASLGLATGLVMASCGKASFEGGEPRRPDGSKVGQQSNGSSRDSLGKGDGQGANGGPGGEGLPGSAAGKGANGETLPGGGDPNAPNGEELPSDDPAKRKIPGEALPDAKSFNVAILTQNTRCFYCHLRIEGDVGGINLPFGLVTANGAAAGSEFSIVGRFFATNDIPNHLLGKSSGGDFPRHSNATAPKIFPKDTSGDGVPDFPSITAEQLKASVKGSLKQASTGVIKTHSGNLILIGTDAQPIVLQGEVFVDGDLIIKGTYTGIGTIYARNIFIASDLLAKDSPFPYPAQDRAASLAKAKQDVAAKKDGLYLGSLGQIIVGDVNHGLSDENFQQVPPVLPWIPNAEYEALGKRSTPIAGEKAPDPVAHTIEVNRVDAFLYAQNFLFWRAYRPLELNGGFMSPRIGLVRRTTGINVIRYDYRLNVHSLGFESLRPFFEAE